MNFSKIAAVLLLAASVTAACVSRWNAGAPLVASPPASTAAFFQSAAAEVDRSSRVEAMAEVPGAVERIDAEGSPTLASSSQTRVEGGYLADAFGSAGAQLAAPQPAQVSDPAVLHTAVGVSASSIRMPVPFRTQKDGDRFQGSNCGPAALGMILDAFGVARGNSDLRFLTHTYQGTVGARTGTALQHMARVAADLGLEPRGLYQRPDPTWGKEGFARWTVEDIRAEVLAGRPVVPLVKFRLLPGHEDRLVRADHYIVIHGVDGDQFLYHDPIYESPWEGGAKWMSAETLAAAMRPTLVPQQAVSFGAGRLAALPTTSR